MKRLIIAAAALSLLTGAAAVSAQEQRAPRDYRPRGADGQVLPGVGPLPGQAPADRGGRDRGARAPQANPVQPQVQGQGGRGDRGSRGQQGGQGFNRGDRGQQGGGRGGQIYGQNSGGNLGQADGGNRWNGQTFGRTDGQYRSASDQRYGGQYRGDNRRNDDRYRSGGGNQWRRGWADTRRFSASSRGSYLRYRASPFRWPSGYQFRRWSINQYLPSIFLSSSYFIPNFYDIGLPYPPRGTEWIRVGDDALLVDIYSGEVIDVVPSVFYW